MNRKSNNGRAFALIGLLAVIALVATALWSAVAPVFEEFSKVAGGF